MSSVTLDLSALNTVIDVNIKIGDPKGILRRIVRFQDFFLVQFALRLSAAYFAFSKTVSWNSKITSLVQKAKRDTDRACVHFYEAKGVGGGGGYWKTYNFKEGKRAFFTSLTITD